MPFAQKADEFQDSGFAFESCDSSKFNDINNCFESCKKSQLPLTSTASDSMYSGILNASDCRPYLTPKKDNSKFKLNSSNHDPLTPTANLKVLLHAASPEIRDYERRKLFCDANSDFVSVIPLDEISDVQVWILSYF